MNIAIIARKRCCARVLECINGQKVEYAHTDTKYYNTNEIAIFTVKGKEEDIIFIEKWIKSEFLTDDVMSLRFVTGKFPMIE